MGDRRRAFLSESPSFSSPLHSKLLKVTLFCRVNQERFAPQLFTLHLSTNMLITSTKRGRISILHRWMHCISSCCAVLLVGATLLSTLIATQGVWITGSCPTPKTTDGRSQCYCQTPTMIQPASWPMHWTGLEHALVSIGEIKIVRQSWRPRRTGSSHEFDVLPAPNLEDQKATFVPVAKPGSAINRSGAPSLFVVFASWNVQQRRTNTCHAWALHCLPKTRSRDSDLMLVWFAALFLRSRHFLHDRLQVLFVDG